MTVSAMQQEVKKRLAAPYMLNPSYTSYSPQESQANYAITSRVNQINFRGSTVNTVYNKLAPATNKLKRDATFRQLAMPWNNVFMHTATDAARLNNPSHQAFVSQRQLTIPNQYNQFYALMKGLSAAFGTLQGG